MKLILAIVHDRDKHKFGDNLLQNGLTFTQIGSTGGFLRQGNSTFLIGVQDEEVISVFEIIRSACRVSERFVNVAAGETAIGNLPAAIGLFPMHPIKVAAGGAVAFVLNVEDFKKF